MLNGEQLLSMLDGLESNDLLENIGYLLTGYIGSESFLRAVLVIVQKLRMNAREGMLLHLLEFFLSLLTTAQ